MKKKNFVVFIWDTLILTKGENIKGKPWNFKESDACLPSRIKEWQHTHSRIVSLRPEAKIPQYIKYVLTVVKKNAFRELYFTISYFKYFIIHLSKTHLNIAPTKKHYFLLVNSAIFCFLFKHRFIGNRRKTNLLGSKVAWISCLLRMFSSSGTSLHTHLKHSKHRGVII